MTEDLAVIRSKDDLERHSIEAYAKRNEMSVDAVWNLIEEGCLRARKVKQTIVILNATFSIDSELLGETELITEFQHPEATNQLATSENLMSLRKFAVAAMDQIGRLNQELVQSKSQIISQQEDKIKDLQQQCHEDFVQRSELKQQLEDLKILNSLLLKDSTIEKS